MDGGIDWGWLIVCLIAGLCFNFFIFIPYAKYKSGDDFYKSKKQIKQEQELAQEQERFRQLEGASGLLDLRQGLYPAIVLSMNDKERLSPYYPDADDEPSPHLQAVVAILQPDYGKFSEVDADLVYIAYTHLYISWFNDFFRLNLKLARPLYEMAEFYFSLQLVFTVGVGKRDQIRIDEIIQEYFQDDYEAIKRHNEHWRDKRYPKAGDLSDKLFAMVQYVEPAWLEFLQENPQELREIVKFVFEQNRIKPETFDF